MFPTRFYPNAMFAPRYFPKAGATSTTPTPVRRIALTGRRDAPTLTGRRDTAIALTGSV